MRGTWSPYHVPRPEGVRAKLDANELAVPAAARGSPPRSAASSARSRSTAIPRPIASALRRAARRRPRRAAGQLVFGNGSDELIALLCAAFAEPRKGATRAACSIPIRRS